MELLFATVIGACLGLLVGFAAPGRNSYGALLPPALGGAATALVWVTLVWFGWTFDGTWIWVVSLAAGVIVPAVAAFVLPGKRRASDAQMLETLSRS